MAYSVSVADGDSETIACGLVSMVMSPTVTGTAAAAPALVVVSADAAAPSLEPHAASVRASSNAMAAPSVLRERVTGPPDCREVGSSRQEACRGRTSLP